MSNQIIPSVSQPTTNQKLPNLSTVQYDPSLDLQFSDTFFNPERDFKPNQLALKNIIPLFTKQCSLFYNKGRGNFLSYEIFSKYCKQYFKQC